MSSSAFHGLFRIQTAPEPVSSPEAAHYKDGKRTLPALEAISLRDFPTEGNSDEFSRALSKAQSPVAETPRSVQTPRSSDRIRSLNELEMSRPPSPTVEETFSQMQSWNDPPVNKWRILSCCLIYFGNGLNDSATGALIPYMEAHYNIGFAVMSLIFVGQAIGFILAAFFNNTILSKLGRAKMLMAAELVMIVAYVILVCTPPYPAVIVAFFLLGYGMAMTLALNNVFCAHIHPASVVLGAAHGSYGVGGIVAPIAATALASHGTLWSRFYFLPFGLALVAMGFAGWAFWGYQEDTHQTLLNSTEREESQEGADDAPVSKFNDLKLALKNRSTIFGALFVFAYQGAEVSISGWVISFLINYRGGDPGSVGYVTAGFWGGITLGRFVLTFLTPYIGERLYVFILVLGTMAFQLLAWLVPNIITNAVAVAILGLLLGPVYPCANALFMKLMPRHVQTTAMGFIAGAGSSGGAVAPFMTGILAQAVGTYVLHPVCLGLYVVMLSCWFALPKVGKRSD